MNKSKVANLNFGEVKNFKFMIKRTCTNKNIHTHQIDLHIHKELELYINLSGNVSFLVENNLYPVSYGDIIIARPGEYHHCVYNSEEEHNFFWILLDCEQNQDLFDFFLKENSANFISPYKKTKDELISLCEKMTYEELSEFEKYYCLLRFINILKESTDNSEFSGNLPDDLSSILQYIDNNISENIKVSDIADNVFLSASTLERKFKKYFGIKPLEFIQKKKMLVAAELLKNGESVLSAGTSVGFSDNSYFINLFKRFYGVTPLEYKQKTNH